MASKTIKLGALVMNRSLLESLNKQYNAWHTLLSDGAITEEEFKSRVQKLNAEANLHGLLIVYSMDTEKVKEKVSEQVPAFSESEESEEESSDFC